MKKHALVMGVPGRVIGFVCVLARIPGSVAIETCGTPSKVIW